MFTSTSRRLTLVSLAAALSAGACARLAGGQCEAASCAEDARIRTEVEKQIDERPSLKFFNIHVQSHNQVVYLQGIVDTRMDQRRAEKIALAVPGVKKVYNELYLDGNGW